MSPAAALEMLRLSLTGGLNAPVGPVPFHPHHFPAWGLRDFQEAMLRRTVGYMRAGVRRILLQLPTGGGKTHMAKAMHGSAAAMGLTSEFLVHRKELVDQTSRVFAGAGIAHGFVAAGQPFDPDAMVRIAGVQTLVRRLDLVAPPNLAVVDEAHHATAASWAEIMNAYREAFIIGLTATPERLDGKGLDAHFDVMIQGPSTAELIARGFLSEFDYYAPGQPDLSGVHTLAGDFNRGEIAELMDKPKLIGDVVEHYLRLAPGEQGIVFAASREHSRHMAEAFAGEGVAAAHVDGAMPDRERDRIVEAFRAGEVRVMTNVDLFGEGFDVPGLVYCGLARPTKSLALHLQQVGRALRTFEGKSGAIVCDHAGNAFRHGLPDDQRRWSLQGRAGRERVGAGASDALPVRQCKTCFRVVPSVVTTCPGCGEAFPVLVRELKQEAGTLTKLERLALKEERRVRRKAEEKACKSLEDFRLLGEARGYDDPRGWARIQHRMRTSGTLPRRAR